jgi:glutathionyl-hydroquinone reductase
LTAFLGRLIALPAFRDTFNLDHIQRGYYSIDAPNPTRLVPTSAWTLRQTLRP